MARQPSSDNAAIFEAFEEIGIPAVLNANDPSFTLGIAEPLITIADGSRQSEAQAYLSGLNRTNFHVLKKTQVTKVLFDANNKAVGVEAINADGETVTINAVHEVILTAGTLSTPQILMLSGVGPRDHLESLNISVISDLPVGKNLRDNPLAVVVHALQEAEPVTAPANPHVFPCPATTAFLALDRNQNHPDYMAINLIFPADHAGFIQLCSLVVGYNNDICQSLYDGASGRVSLLTVVSPAQSLSRGEVLLRSTDPADRPIIHHGIYTNKTDLDNMVLYLQDFSQLVNTTALKQSGSFLVEPALPACKDLERNSSEYWRCYALEMSSTFWTLTSTSALGSVVDKNLVVKNTQGLRVADASALPNGISANINAGVVGFAERAADIIKAAYGPTPR